MADFYAPGQIQQPDLLGSYVRGQLSNYAVPQAQMQMQQGQQQLETGDLNLQQLRQAMALKQQLYARLAGDQPSAPQGAGAQAGGGVSGGIQNGPQAAVAGSAPLSAPASTGIPDVPPLPFSNGTLQAIGLLAPDMAKGIAESQGVLEKQHADAVERLKLQAAPFANQLDSLITSPAPERLLMNNQVFMDGWKRNAPRLGLDPSNPAAMTPQNVRAVATLAYNDLVGQYGGQPKPMPNPMQFGRGSQGQPILRDYITGKEELEPGAQAPSYGLEGTYDINTGHENKVLVQTGGFGYGGKGNAPGVDLGLKAPTAEQSKAAQFANYMVPAVSKLRQLESQGYVLPPSARSMILSAATSEDTGALHSLAQQESLKHLLSPEGQQYMAALMPVLQAAGHSMGGARLTAGQMRANFESLIPVDAGNTEALQTINQSRDSFLRGLVGEAGSAAYIPAYRDTVGKLADSYKTSGNGPPKIGTVVKGYKYIGGAPGNPASWEKSGG